MFDKVKNIYSLQKQAKEIKKELKNTHVEAEVDGVTAIVDGEQEIISIAFPESDNGNLKHLADSAVKALNKAVKKSQQIAAEKMKPLMGGLNIPGMG
jgi:nucleoid-associated protein EbfC